MNKIFSDWLPLIMLKTGYVSKTTNFSPIKFKEQMKDRKWKHPTLTAVQCKLQIPDVITFKHQHILSPAALKIGSFGEF